VVHRAGATANACKDSYILRANKQKSTDPAQKKFNFFPLDFRSGTKRIDISTRAELPASSTFPSVEKYVFRCTTHWLTANWTGPAERVRPSA
jgi:hypothetical protein